MNTTPIGHDIRVAPAHGGDSSLRQGSGARPKGEAPFVEAGSWLREAVRQGAGGRWVSTCWLGLALLCGSPSLATDSDLPGDRSFRPAAGRYGPFTTDPAHGFSQHAYSPFSSLGRIPAPKPVAGRDYVPGRLVVKLKAPENGVTLSVNGLPDLEALRRRFALYGLTGLQRVFPNALPPGSSAKALVSKAPILTPDLTRWLRLGCDTNVDVIALAGALAGDPDVELAEPDYLRRATGGGLPDATSDPLYRLQWHLDATHVPQAWAYLQGLGHPPGGSRDVVVAVVDTGVDYKHPDLAANMWVNSREIPGNGRDDDGNGFVDDVYGIRVEGTHSGDPMDDHGHGTHVAGIIGAKDHNGTGGVGVAYNVRLMAIKAGQYSGQLVSSDVAEGIQYAVANGADVINMSFAGYSKSAVEEDALAVAFGQCVLVAAAGNDGYPNEGVEFSHACNPDRAKAAYPAAYNWVLGVMATSPGGGVAEFSNFDCIPHDAIEYELSAPGVNIWSTLPGNRYAGWSGTSMAAPIVSGIAALARTRWPDKDLYSSRFIMGQIAANATNGANAYCALSVTPRPELSYLQHWTFDTTNQAPRNDQDGRVDAGETIDLAVVIRNHWGKAADVTVRLEALAADAVLPDPYVTWDNNRVSYGAIGAFNWSDNGLLYSNQVIVGVQSPFRFQVATNCPNDHVIPLLLTMTCRNCLDATDPTEYRFEDRFALTVQRGRELPRIITTNMTLTKNDYWIVPGPTLVQTGATVTVTEGTQVQFFSAQPSNPYAQSNGAWIQVEGSLLIQGTPQEPVELFPGNEFVGSLVSIRQNNSLGDVQMQYARIHNPGVVCSTTSSDGVAAGSGQLRRIDHCYFSQDDPAVMRGPVTLSVTRSSNCIFDRLGSFLNAAWPFAYSGRTEESLFDSCWLSFTGLGEHNVFLKNQNSSYRTYLMPKSTAWVGSVFDATAQLTILSPTNRAGSSYVMVSAPTSFDMAELFARHLGGHLATINDQAENEFVTAYIAQVTGLSTNQFDALYPDLAGKRSQFLNGNSCLIGLTDRELYGQLVWMSGEPVLYTNWYSSQLPYRPRSSPYCYVYVYGGKNYSGTWFRDADTYPKLMELPGQWTREQLLQARQNYVGQGQFNQFKSNAVLNVWWSANPTNWLRFVSASGRDTTRYISLNYWATTSRVLLDTSIIDFNDDLNLNRYAYEPVLTNAPESAFPFVVDVQLSTASGSNVAVVGAEPVTFTVTYNRDMNTNVLPLVSFGPDVPMTDYTVHPIDGGWRDARIWRGTFNVTPITGDGYQLIRVAGAVAADDAWLVTGNDAGRFRFEVLTSGTAAMNLQATGGEGRIDLSWMQDDFTLLAGYNLYRSTNALTNFVRFNAALIPADIHVFTDTNVVAGKTYYYKFVVVKSDATESGFSNVAQGTALDTVPPVLTHTPISSAPAGLPLTLLADVTDNVGVQSVTLCFRALGTTTFARQPMTRGSGNRYATTIEGSLVASPGLEYYLEASDGVSVVRSVSPVFPHLVAVVDRPQVASVNPGSGPAEGGTAVAVFGLGFKAGAIVSFDGLTPAETVWVSETQLTCRTPAHYPAPVDVVVTNPDGQSGASLRGFAYEGAGVVLALPQTGGGKGDLVSIPLSVSGALGLAAVDLTVTFDGAVLRGRSVQPGTVSPGWSVVANTNTPGQLRVSMASSGPTASGSGVLVNLEFEVMGVPGASTPLGLRDLSLNDGAIVAQAVDGSFAVSQVYDVDGVVRYWRGGVGVSNVTVSLSGARTYARQTGPNGEFAVAGAVAGSYSLTPVKTDNIRGISAYDASLVLQHAAGLITLDGDAATAADVNKSGQVTAFDAFYILQKSVNLISLPFPGVGTIWEFTPAARSYPTLITNLTGQDFTALLLGDVSGNWASAGDWGLAAMWKQGHKKDDPGATVALRALTTRSNETQVWLLLSAPAMEVFSIEAELTFDPRHGLRSVRSGPAASGWAVSSNTNEAGRVRLALAGALPWHGIGTAAILSLPAGVSNDLQVASVAVNEGGLTVSWDPTGAAFDVDSDGDGQSDWAELRAGTDPLARESVFALESIQANPDKTRTLIWSSVAGRVYQVLVLDDMTDEKWQPAGEAVTATQSKTSWLDAGRDNSAERFYRVQLVE